MTHRNNVEDWLVEFDMPAMGGQGDPAGFQAPMSDPNAGGGPMPPANQDPNITNMPDQGGEPDDIEQDPQIPDMPDMEQKPDDFETWKMEFMKESIKGDVQTLKNMVLQVQTLEGMMPYQKKFVNDNLQILQIRENTNFDEASKQIRKLIREQLDRNNPATSVATHITQVLDTDPMLQGKMYQMLGYGSLKSDLHRKYLAALTGSIQVGSGGDTEDIVFVEREYTIMMSTRFNARWGDVLLGTWTLQEDSPQRFLSEPEAKKLEDGSPEEREVLLKRVVMESIASEFETRAYYINVVDENGTLYTMGWDLATSLKAAYSEGKLVVKFKNSDSSEALISEDGKFVPLRDISIYYAKETGDQDEFGMPEKQEVEFLERRNGMLFLTASMQTIREAAPSLQGTQFRETPYNGNPSDLHQLMSCVYTAHDLIMKQCI